MARDRLSAIRSQQPTSPGLSAPQQLISNRRSYPEHGQSQYNNNNNPRRPFSPESSFRQPTSELRSPPRVPIGSEPRDWSPAIYDEPQSYSGYDSATTSPVRVTSPIREQPRPRPPSRMTSAPRDFNPNEYDSPRDPTSRHHSREPSREQPRDFDPNEPEAPSVRHRIVTRKQTGRGEMDFEETGGEAYGTSSRETYSERDGRSSRGGKRSESDRDGRDSMPILNKNQKNHVTISRGEVPFEDMGEFFAEVTTIQDDIKEANQTIDLISNLYSRYLACPSSEDVQALALHDQLSQKTTSTRGLFASLRNRIHVLEQGNANLDAMIPLGQSIQRLTMSDVSVRQQQVQNLKSRFKDAIQKYAEVEKDNRAKNRAKMERQVRIVYPEMSYEELQGVVRQAEQEGGSALFAQAVRSNGYRSRQAQGALREVQNRAAELSRIEETLVELAQIFSDMATLVEAQDVAIIKIEDDAKEAQLDMEIGLENTKKAVHHARMARKRRWICFFVFVVIFIVLLIVLVVKVVLPEIDKRKNNNNSEPEEQSNNSPTSRATRDSDSGGSGRTVTVTVTTTVVVVRNPVQSMLEEIPSPTPRQILMTVDPAALAAFVDHPLSVVPPTTVPDTPSSTRTTSSRHSSSRHSSSHRSSSSRSTRIPSPTKLSVTPSPSTPTLRQVLVASTPSSRSTSVSKSQSIRPSSRPQSRSTSSKASSSTSKSQSRTTSSTRSTTSSRPTGFVSIRRESTSRSSSSRSPSSTLSSTRPRPTGLIDSLSSVLAAFSKAHLDAEPSHLHPPSSASNKSASSSITQKSTKAARSAISSDSTSITSIIQALLRRCVSAATPTITF